MNIRYDWFHKRRENSRRLSSERFKELKKIYKGSKHPRAKLNELQVLKIRKLAKTKSHTDIAKLFGVCRPNITLIINRKLWAYI